MSNGINSSNRPPQPNDTDLTGRIVLFSHYLKEHGFRVFSSDVADALKGLCEIDILMREDFYSVLRANLVSSDLEWQLFDELFESFWHPTDRDQEKPASREGMSERTAPEGNNGEMKPEDAPMDRVTEDAGEDSPDDETAGGAVYSPVSRVACKSLEQFRQEDIQVAQLLLKNMMSPFRVAMTRRRKRSNRAQDMDFRRIFKKSLKTEGTPLLLFFKKKKKRLKRLVLITDVSGSMDRYARFVLPFLLGIKGVGTKAEVFVFSTSLTPITSILRHHAVEKALENLSKAVPDWSGGTRIGHSLHQFNQGYGGRLLNRKSVVVIMSDGWDLGGREILKREMAVLNRKAHCVIWLNPLAEDPDFRPVSGGMLAALPYVDYFLPADSLQSLKRVGRTLTKVMNR